ncbi:MAG: hypothetical protein Q8O00_02815, partial [Holophaga sp.]|nr:hypothetical protein [Holophaga sp.]
MRIPFRSAFGAILSIAVLAAPVTFTAGGKAGTAFKGKELKQLTASAKLPQKLGAMKFDRIRVVMKLSHLDVVASIVYDRANVPAAWMGAKALTFDLVREGDGSDFEGYGLKDFTSVPQRRKLDEMSADIKVLLLKKIGEKEEKRWDESRSAFVKSKIPVFDAGTAISEGTVKVLLERQAGDQDK